MRSRKLFSSGPSGAYTYAIGLTSSYMLFCTSAAWKCPGSRVIRVTGYSFFIFSDSFVLLLLPVQAVIPASSAPARKKISVLFLFMIY
jgi:hypothetical protein